nr:hypothetical protein [Bacteroidota bacterium]
MDKKLVIITGMHRSGTSALARVVIDLGFDPGNNLLQPGKDNPEGFWEDIDILNLNNDILEFLFLTWDRVEDFNGRLIHKFGEEVWNQFGDRALAVLSGRMDHTPAVMLKDPRFSILLPFWKKAFNHFDCDKFYLLPVRNPFSVARSLGYRNGTGIENGQLLWYYYNISALSDPDQTYCVVDYDQLLNEPVREINRLSGYLGIPEKDNQGIIQPFYQTSLNKKLNHYPVKHDQFVSSTPLFQEIGSIWNKLSYLAQLEVRDIVPINTEGFLKPALSKLHTRDPLPKYSATLYCTNGLGGKAAEIITVGFSAGSSSMVFEIQNVSAHHEFHLHIGDRPCFIRLDNVIVKTETGTEEYKITDGNFIHHKDNQFYFNTNKPFFRFKIPPGKKLISIALHPNVDFFEYEGLLNLLPVLQGQVITLKSNLEKSKKQEIALGALRNQLLAESMGQKEKEVAELTNSLSAYEEKSKEHLLERRDLKKRIKNLGMELKNEGEKNRSQASDLKQHRTRVAFLIKKGAYLNEELVKLRNTQSWKITAPFRWAKTQCIRAARFDLPIVTDIYKGFYILKHEGPGRFIKRLCWYARGKRLGEDIESFRKLKSDNTTEIIHSKKSVPIT